MATASEELQHMRREESDKRAFDEATQRDPSRSGGGLSSRSSHPSRPFTRQSLDDLACCEDASLFEGELNDILLADQERMQRTEDEKSKYMSMFY